MSRIKASDSQGIVRPFPIWVRLGLGQSFFLVQCECLSKSDWCVCESYSCSFLILEAYGWRLLPCKHILLRLANLPNPMLYIINMLMSWFVVVLVPLHQCLHSPPAPRFLGCLSFLHFLHTPSQVKSSHIGCSGYQTLCPRIPICIKGIIMIVLCYRAMGKT